MPALGVSDIYGPQRATERPPLGGHEPDLLAGFAYYEVAEGRGW